MHSLKNRLFVRERALGSLASSLRTTQSRIFLCLYCGTQMTSRQECSICFSEDFMVPSLPDLIQLQENLASFDAIRQVVNEAMDGDNR